MPPFKRLFHTLHPVITGFMEVIIAAFEMQTRLCILRLKRGAVCLNAFVCVFWIYVCLVAHNDSSYFVSCSLLIVCASTGDERNWHSGEMAVQAEDWSQVKERWEIPDISVTPSQRSLFRLLPVTRFSVFPQTDLPLSIHYNTLKCKALKLNFYFHLDPHVKVEGKRANVLEAKKKILEVLETRVRALVLFTICLNSWVNNVQVDMLLHVFHFASLQKKLFGKSFCYKV